MKITVSRCRIPSESGFLLLKRLVFYSSKVLDFTIDTWNGRRSPRKHFDKETKNVK